MVKKRTDRPIVQVDEASVGQVLPSGQLVVVSAEDEQVLRSLSWSRDGRGYVVAFIGRVNGTQKFVKLHREVIRAFEAEIVDHVDGDKLNCRRSNLRIASKAQNAANIRKIRSGAGFKGVRTSVLTANSKKPFQAAIVVGGRVLCLGTFETAIEAAQAYDQAAVRAFGAFAATNAKMGLL